MDRCFGKELKEAMDAGDDLEFMKLVPEAMQHYTDKIIAALNPVKDLDTPFIIAALQTIIKTLSANDPEGVVAAKAIVSLIGVDAFSVPVPHGKDGGE